MSGKTRKQKKERKAFEIIPDEARHYSIQSDHPNALSAVGH
jgi:hypothetical protein